MSGERGGGAERGAEERREGQRSCERTEELRERRRSGERAEERKEGRSLVRELVEAARDDCVDVGYGVLVDVLVCFGGQTLVGDVRRGVERNSG